MLILASASPRRRELMDMMGFQYQAIPADIEEKIPEGTPSAAIPGILAGQKARAVLSLHPEDVVIGSDTIVEVDGKVLGKPRSEEEAFEMLSMLSGRTHRVHTGVAILADGYTDCFTSSAEVTFYDLSEEEIRAYIATGVPMDKAGAYGIQGIGAVLVRCIKGDFYTIMGFPIAEVTRRLKHLTKMKTEGGSSK